ncbi:pituitary tumor-transforming gene 1 protein-interacting protein isoform X2 [Patella vulgata]|uniref:pituitary tumor-transforming gene 1 protein-interacting protein isoform X2 n=1 Tax=Patella vulgata TaxID=6465 RepID=UPI0024A90E59|nr:pituitary tumor-transforming gene 1 protein-interacting protein isoform X2 [Patella vulgata]
MAFTVISKLLLVSLLGASAVYSASTTPQDTPTSSKPASTSSTTPVPSATSPPNPSPTTPVIPTTSLTPEEECAQYNGSCSDCVGAPKARCLYCNADEVCKPYPFKDVIPSSSVCPLSKARWTVCWLNFEAMLISVGVLGGIILLTITCCCVYCCCCRGGNKKRYDKEDAKWERQKKDRKEKAEERKMERKDRLDEIRRKYGLVKEDNAYERFDA